MYGLCSGFYDAVCSRFYSPMRNPLRYASGIDCQLVNR